MNQSTASHIQKRKILPLAFLALGIVYGDIGTSPLYTLSAVFGTHSGIALNHDNILGTISAIFWSLIIIVTIKYVTLVLRADNRGEGGVLSLLTLVTSVTKEGGRRHAVFLLLGISGASLFLAESVITPAISVLGAIEGLNYLAEEHEVTFNLMGIAILILAILFYVQKTGTAVVGKYFGYVMFIWFFVLAVSGLVHIIENPFILAALNPIYAYNFLTGAGSWLFIALGGIVLAITGVEALYADMGHLGRNPIRFSWLLFVMPSLALNYFGQGASLLANPEEAIKNPFYSLFPEDYVFLAVILATFAAIIASQAVISGTFSMTRQAIQLGLLPRINIVHKSSSEIGQIYIPFINWVLFGLVVIAVILFRSTAHLASAYGIAVTMTMTITTLLTFQVVRRRWRYPYFVALISTGFFLFFDFAFVIACLSKIWTGGWFTLLLAALVFICLTTWRQGKMILTRSTRSEAFDLDTYVQNLSKRKPHTLVPRTAIYLLENPDAVPSALIDNLKHNMVLHQRNIFLTVKFMEAPKFDPTKRLEIKQMTPHFWRVRVQYGFMEQPDVPAILELMRQKGLDINSDNTSYFLSHQAVISTEFYGMGKWREEIFSLMYRNASSVFQYFNIPPSNVVILGSRVQI